MKIKNNLTGLNEYELVRFLAVGFVTILVDLTLYFLLFNIGFDTFWAKGLSYVIVTIFAYYANKKITFKTNRGGSKRFIFFVILYSLTLSVNVGINEVILLANTFSFSFFSYAFAYLTATIASAVLNFIGMKYIIFGLGKKWFFSKTFFPKHEDNHMVNEGNLSESRSLFLRTRFNNLDFLLRKRYEWMNEYLKPKMKIVEIGCGGGLSKLFLSEDILLTDAANNDWVEKFIDATDMDFEDSSIDVIVASHTIHHFHNPAKFFKECSRVLTQNGIILISEINTSLSMRIILKLMRHEGYSYDVDVFNYQSICNDKDDLWSANCAIPQLLFEDEAKFNNFFPELKIHYQKKTEFSIFPLSGGVVSKKSIFEIPSLILTIFDYIDRLLIFFFPEIFAMGRKVVIKKTSSLR